MCHHPFTLFPNSFSKCLLGVAELEGETLQPRRAELGRGTATAAQAHPHAATRHGCRTVRLKMPRRQIKNPPWHMGTCPVLPAVFFVCLLVFFNQHICLFQGLLKHLLRGFVSLRGKWKIAGTRMFPL